MKSASQVKRNTLKRRLFYVFFLVMLILSVVIVISLINLNQASNDEKGRHQAGNYARIETMLSGFESYVDRITMQNRLLSSSLHLTPFFATASRETLEEDQAHQDSKLRPLLQWHQSFIGEDMEYCVSIRYSPASGCYLGASLDQPDGFLAPDFASLYQLIHLSGQVAEADFLEPGSYHICSLEACASSILLYTSLHEDSGTILIYGFQPKILDSTIFSANIGPSYQYLSTHLVLPDGQSIFSSADGEDDFTSSDLRKLLLEEQNIFISGEKTIMKIQERNGGFSLVYSLIDIQPDPINGNEYKTLLICMVLFMIVMVLMAVFVLRLLYRPLQMLASAVPAPSQSDDPFLRISSALDYYRQQADLKQLTIEHQNDTLYRSILLKMMLDPSYILSEKETAYFQMDQRLRSFVLMSAEASNEEWAPEKMSHSERVYHRNLALLDAESEIEAQYVKYAPVCLRYEKKTFILFQVGEEELSLLRNSLMDTLVHLNQQKKAAYVFRFGQVHSSPGELRNAYQEVLLHPDYTLSADREPARQEPVSVQQMLQLENRLISLVYIESYQKSYECLAEIIRLIYQNEKNETLIKSQVQSISLRTFRMLMESNADHPSRLNAYSAAFDQLQEYTLGNVLEFWRLVFEDLEGTKAPAGLKTSSDDFNAILQYIQLHFKDPNLSLTNLADLFHRPVASLSRDFQKYLDKGFLEVLHGLRLDAAEEEIASTADSMKVIAERVGYTSEITMNRAFKKYRGVTPGAYRAKSEKKVE